MKLFSTNAASLVLEKDRRTLTKAMQGVAPDAKVNGQARWRLRKFIDALDARERPAARDGAAERLSRVDEIEAAFGKLDSQFARLQAEPDLERRRALAVKIEIGHVINNLDELMQAANRMDEQTGTLMQIVSNKLVGGEMSKLIELCEWWDDAELYCASK
jgi:hypothetical protein